MKVRTQKSEDSTDEFRNNFFMYYSTMLKDTKEKAIGFGVSFNGFAWTKQGIALKPSVPLNGAGCARCNVIQKATLNGEGCGRTITDGSCLRGSFE